MRTPDILRAVLGGAFGCLVVLCLVAGIRWAATLSWLGGPVGLAGWVQAVGSIAAVLGALWIALNANAIQRQRDAEARSAVTMAAYMMIYGVQNTASKSVQSLREAVTAEFWKLEGGTFMQDLYDQMNRLPIHETADPMTMGAFENARAMLTVMSKMHSRISGVDETVDGYAEYLSSTVAGIKAMEARCILLAAAVATKLPAIPEVDVSLFSESELDSFFGSSA